MRTRGEKTHEEEGEEGEERRHSGAAEDAQPVLRFVFQFQVCVCAVCVCLYFQVCLCFVFVFLWALWGGPQDMTIPQGARVVKMHMTYL
jgi:hypothetical protein